MVNSIAREDEEAVERRAQADDGQRTTGEYVEAALRAAWADGASATLHCDRSAQTELTIDSSSSALYLQDPRRARAQTTLHLRLLSLFETEYARRACKRARCLSERATSKKTERDERLLLIIAMARSYRASSELTFFAAYPVSRYEDGLLRWAFVADLDLDLALEKWGTPHSPIIDRRH